MRFTLLAHRALPRWRRLLLLTLAAVLATAGVPASARGAGPLLPNKPDRTVSFDGLVYASAYVGSTVYVGGSFRNAIVNGRLVPRKGLAAVDARTGALLPWAPAANRAVRAMVAAGSWLYITGKFSTVNRQSRRGLASVHLSSGALGAFRHTVTGTGQALATSAGRLYLGGKISAVDGRTVGNLAAFTLSGGAQDRGFRGHADGEVRALVVAGSRLYVGGAFRKLNRVTGTARLGALRLPNGQLKAHFRPKTPYWVDAITVGAGAVYAGLAGPGGRVAAYRGNGSLIWSTVTDGDVQAVAYLAGVLYAGGHFTVACPRPSRTATSWCPATLRSQPKLEALDPATGWLRSWNPRSNGNWGVLTMSANATLGAIAVGGQFTAFAGTRQPYFAQFTLAG